MKYRDRTTGQIYTLFEVQQKFSNVSFPLVWDSTTFEFANVDPVRIVPQPSASAPCMRCDYVGVQLLDGQWTDVWMEVPLYDDPTEQSSCEAGIIENQWGIVRNERTALLTQTDYTQLPDTPITPTSKAEFVTYRQQLRDITQQSDPYNIVWPTLPIYQKE